MRQKKKIYLAYNTLISAEYICNTIYGSKIQVLDQETT